MLGNIFSKQLPIMIIFSSMSKQFVFNKLFSFYFLLFKIPSNTSSNFLTVALPYTSPFTVNTGAKPQAPTHLVSSIENKPSFVVSPGSIFNLSLIYPLSFENLLHNMLFPNILLYYIFLLVLG